MYLEGHASEGGLAGGYLRPEQEHQDHHKQKTAHGSSVFFLGVDVVLFLYGKSSFTHSVPYVLTPKKVN